MIKYFVIAVFMLSGIALTAQSEKKLTRSGNNMYEDGNFTEAEVQYRKALTENPNYYKGKFNLGDAMYEQENFEESAKIFNELVEANLSPEQKSSVYYNQGNNLMKEQKWGEAVEAFKNSLRLNPADFDAKYNLEYARKKLSEQQQQQQQNQDQNQDQDKQDEQDQQDKQDQKDQNEGNDKQDQDKEQQDKQDQNQDQQQDQKDQKQDQQQQQQQQQISKQDAQRMLDALKNDEKQTLQKLQKEKAKAAKGKKTDIDW